MQCGQCAEFHRNKDLIAIRACIGIKWATKDNIQQQGGQELEEIAQNWAEFPNQEIHDSSSFRISPGKTKILIQNSQEYNQACHHQELVARDRLRHIQDAE